MEDEIALSVIGSVDRILASRGLDRKALSALIGISQPSMSKMLNKRKGMATSSIVKLATVLGVETSDLLAKPKVVKAKK